MDPSDNEYASALVKGLALYRRIAAKFFNDFKDVDKHLADLLEQFEKEQAIYVLETLCSVARELGAKELVDRGYMLKLAIENSEGDDPKQWEKLLENFSTTLQLYFKTAEFCDIKKEL